MKLKWPGRAGAVFAVVTGLIALALPFVFTIHHGEGFWETMPLAFTWWAAFGAVGCALIVLVSKWLGAVLLQKREDWYDQ